MLRTPFHSVALFEGSVILINSTQGSGFAVTLGYTLSPTPWALKLSILSIRSILSIPSGFQDFLDF